MCEAPPQAHNNMKDFVQGGKRHRDIKDFLFVYEVLIKFTGNSVQWRKGERLAGRMKGQSREDGTTWTDDVKVRPRHNKLNNATFLQILNALLIF